VAALIARQAGRQICADAAKYSGDQQRPEPAESERSGSAAILLKADADVELNDHDRSRLRLRRLQSSQLTEAAGREIASGHG